MFKRYAPALVALAVGCGAQTGVVGETELGIGSQNGDDEGSGGAASNPNPRETEAGAPESGSDAGPAPEGTAQSDPPSAPSGALEEDVTSPPSEANPTPTPSGADPSPNPVEPTAEPEMPPPPVPAVDPAPTDAGMADPIPEPCTDSTEIPLPPQEIATRLSRLLFNAAPTPELLERAEEGELATYGQVECVASEMLEEPEAADGLLAFLNTWLLFESWPYSPDPALDIDVWTEMKQQATTYLEDFATSDDTTLERLLTENQSYVGPQLAQHLGLEETGELPAVITVPQQRGLLTLGLVTASLHRIGPRGRWVLETLQCVLIPPKPPDLAPPTFPDGEGYQKSYLASLSEPVCNGCHSLMDPYGMGLENFDSVGRFQTEEAGAPLLVSGVLYGEDTASAADTSFDGLDDFTAKLAGSGLVARCLADKMLYHAAGVDSTLADPQALEQERDRLSAPFEASGGDLSSLLVAVTQVDSFWQ